MMSLIVLTPKGPSFRAETRHLSHKAWISVLRFELGVCARKKGLDRKKVTKGLYFTYLERSSHRSDVHEYLLGRWCSRRNHVYQVSKWNFKGLRFYTGSNFPFSYWFLNGLYNSVALLRCLWCTVSGFASVAVFDWPNVKHSVLSNDTVAYTYLQYSKHSHHDAARRAVLRSVRRYSLLWPRYSVGNNRRSAKWRSQILLLSTATRCFPGPTRVLDATGISIASAAFAGLTKWQTDRPCYSVGNNRRSAQWKKDKLCYCLWLQHIFIGAFDEKYTMTAFPSYFVSVHQMAPPLTEVWDIQLHLTTHLSTPMG